MIVVDVALDEYGRLRSCRVKGHADVGRLVGDPVCAAVSILVRTAARTLDAAVGIELSGKAERRGSLELEAAAAPEGEAFLSAVTAFLLEGLRSVAADYPRNCMVRIESERRIQHGSQKGR